MASTRYTTFETAIGTCGIAWHETAIAAVSLPEISAEAMLARIHRRAPDAVTAEPPEFVQAIIASIIALLGGARVDLSRTPLDMTGLPEFHRRAYEVALTIPAGETMSYGDVAKRLGEPGAARAVGQAMGANRFPIIVPCHRVLAAGAKTGGFSARGGIDTKMAMLEIEGALTKRDALPFDALPLQARPRQR